MRIRVIIAISLSVVMFAIPLVHAEEVTTFFINSHLVDCVGVGPQKCMQVREDQNSDWLNFYDEIEGFTFVEGRSYQITVRITDVENPLADASSIKYELIEVIEQKSTTRYVPYKNTCVPGFVPLGEICVLNDRCGPGAYAGKVCVMDGIKQPYLRPLQQGNGGISASNVICAEDLELIFKSHDGSPACVKPSSVAKLIEREWAIHVLPDIDSTLIQNSELTQNGKYEVETSSVSYDDSMGFLAIPVSTESFPGIIMIHEWWGLNENMKETATKLASHGYVVLAVDLFNGDVATDAQKARQMVSNFEQEQGTTNMNSAINYLQTNHDIDKVGSIGWCFGGAQSLDIALNNEDMDATVIYYGRLVTDQDTLSKIQWPVLGIFAGLDQGIPVKQVREFENSLNELGISNEIHIYPGVDHAFANPTGERYAPIETDDAWGKTLKFLKENLS